MVSAKTIIILGGIGIFFLAGGLGLSKSAFAQVQTDFSSLRGGVSERVTNVQNTIKRETGQEVGLTKQEKLIAEQMTLPIADDVRDFGDFGKDFERPIKDFEAPRTGGKQTRDPKNIPPRGISPIEIGRGIIGTGGKQFDRSRGGFRDSQFGNLIRTSECRAGECGRPRVGGVDPRRDRIALPIFGGIRPPNPIGTGRPDRGLIGRNGKPFIKPFFPKLIDDGGGSIFTRDTGVGTSSPDVQFGKGFTQLVDQPQAETTQLTQAQKIEKLRSRGGFGA